ncbi:SLC13 family permease [Paucisalibacillus sp. EB02]|uniref:SLC13 family permease n=1 Tax=Paucisalibacillus sp. EB02 TaxID=1347087 RepID=UPI0004BBD100|nr:SLC13 family permease [Paucisalibacillus sp. EB02]
MKRVLRELHLNRKTMLYLLLGMACFMFLGFEQSNLFLEFSSEQEWTLVLLFIAMFLWIVNPIPSSASSILILSLMLVFHLVDDIENALSGFSTSALYFVLMLSIISQALVKVRIDRIIARFLFKVSKGGPKAIFIGLPLFMLVSPILLPSAVARFKILLPLLRRLNSFYGYSDKSLFMKFCVYIIGMMNQNATMVIYTGGGFPILASQLIRDFEIGNFGWIDWFLIIAPPLWIGSLIFLLFVWQFLKYTTPDEDKFVRNDTLGVQNQEYETITSKTWVVVVAFLCMIVTWIVVDQDFPILLPPMLLVVFYAIPKMGLVTNKVIRDFDWENFLMLGASFSLGILIQENGTASKLAKLLIGFVPDNIELLGMLLIIASIVFILRFFFIVPSSAIIVIFPIVMSYADILGIEPMKLAFLTVMVTGSVMVLPIHSTAVYYGFQTGVFTKKEHYLIGVATSLFFMVVSVLTAFLYW